MYSPLYYNTILGAEYFFGNYRGQQQIFNKAKRQTGRDSNQAPQIHGAPQAAELAWPQAH